MQAPINLPMNRIPINANARISKFHAVTMACLVPVLIAHGETTPAYSHDSGASDQRTNWMAIFPDSTKIIDLSIPGTHETMALHGGDAPQCQSKSLNDQLTMGIRAIDIRLADQESSYTDLVGATIYYNFIWGFNPGNYFQLAHGEYPLTIDQQAVFTTDVLDVLKAFLTAHPSETIFMRVKDEWKTNPGYTQADKDGFNSLFASTIAQYPGLFWTGPSNETYDQLTLGAVRGKVVIMQGFYYGTQYGLVGPMKDSPPGGVPEYDGSGTADVQDSYDVSSEPKLYPKWELIKPQLIHASTNQAPANFTLFMNYLSGASAFAYPYFVASGHSSDGTGAPLLWTGYTTGDILGDAWLDFPTVDGGLGIQYIDYEGTDILTMRYLNANPSLTHIGMVFADFPDYGLINAIIAANGNITSVVTTTRDSGAGSLRNTIKSAYYQIGFDPSLTDATITLTTDNITNNGPIRHSGNGINGLVRITTTNFAVTRIGR